MDNNLNPTQQQLLNRQIAVNQGQQAPDPSSATFDVQNLNASNLQFPQAPQGPDYTSILNSIPTISDSFAGATQAVPGLQQAEQAQGNLTSRLLASMQKLTGRGQDQAAAEQQFGVQGLQQNAQELQNRVQMLTNEALAIPLQIQQESFGRGRTAGGVAPIEQGRLRTATIQALQASALSQAANNNLLLAQQQADRSVELKYKPVEDEIAFLKEIYILNQDFLTRADQKRSELFTAQLNERTRILEAQKAEEQNINTATLQAAQAGLPADVIQKAQDAGSYKGAIATLVPALSQMAQDNKAAQDAMDALDRQYKNAQIDSIYASLAAQTQARAEEQAQKDRSVRDSIPMLEANIDQIQAALDNDDGLQSVVGTTEPGRIPFIEKFTGEAQDFLGDVETIISQETLNTLINAKAQGATFGALSETELAILQTAATKLNQWAIRGKDGKVRGFDANEQSVRDELTNIKNMAIRAKLSALGSTVSPYESQSLTEIIQTASQPLFVTPDSYYAQ